MTDRVVKGFKLMRKRKDGTYGPLFINRKKKLVPNKWYNAECHPTSGFQVRQGWHAMRYPEAPHLSEKDRVWVEVELKYPQVFFRPESQGGQWFLAESMRIIREVV